MSATIDEWIKNNAIPFPSEASAALDTAVARMMEAVGSSVELLGVGEALHGTEEILQIRNRLFQTLVKSHGFSAIAIETSFPQARSVNEYVLGLASAEDESVKTWFNKGFGLLEANRELVEWMREYNTDSGHTTKLRFYGFDIPLGEYAYASPRVVLLTPLNLLQSVETPHIEERKNRIFEMIGADAEWENAKAISDPSLSIGQSPRAVSLRIETEELISELRIRAPELIGRRGRNEYYTALHDAITARQLLNNHAAQARGGSYEQQLGIRDVVMADNLEYLVAHERSRGKVLAYAHNGHLKRGQMQWQMGEQNLSWWTAGEQITERMGNRYAVIGSGVGSSEDNGIAQPEKETLEARLIATSGEARFIPTRRGEGIDQVEIGNLPVRSGSAKNATYFPLSKACFTEYDGLFVVNTTAYNRGGPPLQAWTGSSAS